MNRDNRYTPYDRPPPPQQRQNMSGGGGNQFQQGYNNNANNQPPMRRNDFNSGGGGGGGRRGGGGGPMRDNRFGRNDRFNNDRGNNNRRPPPPINRNNYEYNDQQDGGGYGGYQDNYNNNNNTNVRGALASHHIERRAQTKEKACRTLFVRNVQYNITEDEVKALFAEFGEIKDVFNLIENRGMIFVTFYDVRSAERAKNAMQGFQLRDRNIDVHYSLPKEEEEKARCDRTKNQGTLLYTLKHTDAELDDDELEEYFGQFGAIKAIRVPHFKKTPSINPSHYERNQQRLVEFYDSRDCLRAYDNTFEQEYKGGKWDVAFFWDHPYRDRANANQRRERNNDRDRSPPPPRKRRISDQYDAPVKAEWPVKNEFPSIKAEWPTRAPAPAPVATGGYQAPHQQMDPRLYSQRQQQQAPVMASGSSGPQLQQAQKAQQLLSMLASGGAAQAQAQQTSPYAQNSSPAVTSPHVPPSQPHLLQQPFVQPVPPTEDSQTNIHQLLGLLAQAQKAQIQQQQQQPAPVQYQPAPAPVQQPVQLPVSNQGQQQQQQQQQGIPGMDTVTALNQLAALLSQGGGQQQSNQSNHSPQLQPPYNNQ